MSSFQVERRRFESCHPLHFMNFREPLRLYFFFGLPLQDQILSYLFQLENLDDIEYDSEKQIYTININNCRCEFTKQSYEDLVREFPEQCRGKNYKTWVCNCGFSGLTDKEKDKIRFIASVSSSGIKLLLEEYDMIYSDYKG